jgi:hypothetical protein
MKNKVLTTCFLLILLTNQAVIEYNKLVRN